MALRGEVSWHGPPGGPGTHAGSSPEGDTAFDEQHPHVAVADHEQHAAEAQVDEADEDLHGLRSSGRLSQAGGAAPHRPLAAPSRACSPASGPRRGNHQPHLLRRHHPNNHN